MNTRQAYNKWSETYDSVPNKTRDLEALAIKHVLKDSDFKRVLEIGCGSGKNTTWLIEKTKNLVAVDFSEGMLEQARKKLKGSPVQFQQADITLPWNFKNNKATLVICSLVLEHIENIAFIFNEAADCLDNNGCFYVCELHPYKQLEGSRARFELAGVQVQLEYFIHHISDFFEAASKCNLKCIDLREWFDDDDKKTTPRLVSFLFQKQR
jgi:ubiquinone/menaquinone biosynthesis C-methylase UbiE